MRLGKRISHEYRLSKKYQNKKFIVINFLFNGNEKGEI